MTLDALRHDALRSTEDGTAVLLGLPWIRSLPLASLADLTVSLDGQDAGPLTVVLDGREVGVADLAHEGGWWFLQDRIEVRSRVKLSPAPHDVAVSFRLVVPYLQTGPDGPLSLPFRFAHSLTPDAGAAAALPPAPTPSSTLRSQAGSDERTGAPLPGNWMLAASAFNWTPEVIRAERPASDIAVGIVRDGLADVIEIEPGQLWRSFPRPAEAEVDAFRDDLDAVGGSVSIVGASLDDWSPGGARRSDEERLEFLLPQLTAAHRVGAA